MRFCEQLNEYITRLDCRGKELAEALLEKQTLLYSEIQAICGRYRDVPAA